MNLWENIDTGFVILLQFQRRNRIYKEEQRQIRAAARKAKEEAEGAPAVAAHH
jgi:NADH dehydrogenase (ubiquinone) Fe-S protein 5